MLTIKRRQNDYLELEAHDIVTKDDYETIKPQIEDMFEHHDKVRCLLKINDFKGWTMQGFMEELKLSAAHRKDFTKVAVVGERTIHKLLGQAAKPLLKAEVRYFDADEERAALQWLGAPRDPVDEAGVESFPASDPPAI